mmetsp:Transcript_19286/g.28725  ORF Transcript_19286/g.28725 Transcript_19286/m.28725 type:complete len:127 (-) Transcript_19286:8-388(-)
MSIRLTNFVILTNKFTQSVQFYQKGLGLSTSILVPDRVAKITPFSESTDFTISLAACDDQAKLSKGYSPLLNFTLPSEESFNETLPKLIEYGGELDGSIEYDTDGRTVSIRSPCGTIVSLIQLNQK